MGKVRARTIGDEETEKKEKADQKQKSAEKKSKKAEIVEVEAKVTKSEEKKVETEEKTAKKEKKSSKSSIVESTPKHGKKYKEARKGLEKGKAYTIAEALTLLKKLKYAKFDESVELHLNVEKTGLKGEIDLPHSTGKTTSVAIVTDELLKQLEEGVINFDVLVTHPSYMPKLARFAKLLGPRGLMPNPKAGTVSANPEEVVKKFAGGTLRWKSEPKFPIVHQMIGKVSMDEKQLAENASYFLKSVGKVNVLSAFITTTMGPSFRLQVDQL